MDNKESLHGAGVYYFALTGAKQQAIFHSVFEYDYATKLLAKLNSAHLLAYVFEQYSVQCVLRVQHDWTDTLAEIQSAFEHLHERCWNKRTQVLSEHATVLHIDEATHLVPTILQLHDWPRLTGKVADASVWPYSSDRYYRQPEPPVWLHTDAMLNLLAHSRRNRHWHYQTVMSNPLGETFDFSQGTHEHYWVLARPEYVEHYLNNTQQPNLAHPLLKLSANYQSLFQQACQLVSQYFDISQDELLDKTKRQRFHRLMPLVVWLMRLANAPFDVIAKYTDEDEVRLELWLRNLDADHTRNTKERLQNQWAANLHHG